MVELSESATGAVRRLIAASGNPAAGLRIMVDQGGCSGLRYLLGLENEPAAGDEIYDWDGVKLFVDPQSLPIIDGIKIDFVDSVGRAGFVFDNPNVRDVCSCGKSFGA
jgi:iron-sulfur cluster assembly accessory protein